MWRSKKAALHIQTPEELQGTYCSPGRGWYHIYTFCPEQRDEEQLKWLPLEEDETLALIRLDIGAFRDKDLDEETLQFTECILSRFAEAGKDIILRILYDTQGRGMVREPRTIGQVCRHMQSLGTIVAKHSKEILLTQGLFVGSWGEMHDSKFLSPEDIRHLWKIWRDATSATVPIAVRRPSYARMIVSKEDTATCVGLYDDALLADETHMGTFGQKMQSEASWQESWCADAEYEYIRNRMNRMPIGGEVLQPQTELSDQQILDELRTMQISYLNRIYHPDALEMWKSHRLRDGETLYSYIGNHMGYRLVIRNIACRRKTLLITIENNGFAPLYEKVQVKLEMTGEYCRTIDISHQVDLRLLKPGTKQVYHVDNLPELFAERGYCLYIRVQRVRDKREICFANVGAKNQLLIGRIE